MWYFQQNGTQKGPVAAEEIESLFKQGEITQQTFVWKEGMQDWTPVSKTELNNQGLIDSKGAVSTSKKSRLIKILKVTTNP